MAAKKKTAIEAIRDEHICMQRDRSILKKELAKPLTRDNFHDWKMKFLWRLQDFRFHLANHIDLEEDGGFMTEIIEMAPEKDARVKRLAKDHKGILEKMDQLIDELRPLIFSDKEKFETMSKDLNILLQTIDYHESKENDLIQGVFYQDYGFPST